MICAVRSVHPSMVTSVRLLSRRLCSHVRPAHAEFGLFGRAAMASIATADPEAVHAKYLEMCNVCRVLGGAEDQECSRVAEALAQGTPARQVPPNAA